MGCLLYAIAFYKSPFDLILEKGDSVALAVQSGSDSVKIPTKSSFSKGFHDLIFWMLNLDLNKRPFIEDIISKVSVLVEASEDKLWLLGEYKVYHLTSSKKLITLSFAYLCDTYCWCRSFSVFSTLKSWNDFNYIYDNVFVKHCDLDAFST